MSDEDKYKKESQPEVIARANFVGMLLEAEANAKEIASGNASADELRLKLLGPNSEIAKLTKQIRLVPPADRQEAGTVLNEVKRNIEALLANKLSQMTVRTEKKWFDPTVPGILPAEGHLHIVTEAITEITRIFERIGFTRVRHPEVDWDWYAFEALNMPKNHPARDEWETFFIDYPGSFRHSGLDPESNLKNKTGSRLEGRDDIRRGQIVLTPHTSNGQVREMEKGKLPIRMINIAKCYRRQSDVSHVPMFHQFEGLYIDKNVSIGHLKGVLDYFAKQFFGPERVTRIRPFHFQFTEPSFEVDVSCGVCDGTGVLKNGESCKICKSGWLELGGAGMVHPNVLKSGGIDPDLWNGFAFGWGVERTYMMKSGTELDDIRLLYSNDVRFLEQF